MLHEVEGDCGSGEQKCPGLAAAAFLRALPIRFSPWTIPSSGTLNLCRYVLGVLTATFSGFLSAASERLTQSR